MNVIIEQIKQLIRDAKALVNDSVPTPHDFITLKESAIQLELKGLIKQLEQITEESGNIEELKDKFKSLCTERAKANSGSAFDFFASPNSAANKLCWSIGCKLFDIKTQEEAISLFAPTITQSVTMRPEVIDSSKRQDRADNVRFNIRAESSLPKTEASLEHMGDYVVVDNLLFDLEHVSAMPLDYLQQFTTELKSSKELKHLLPAIYEHNDAFRQLKDDIDTLDGAGKTMRQVIQQFAIKLRLGSSYVTGNAIASSTAAVAFTDFVGYMNSLPAHYKEQLLKMSDGTTTLEAIIGRLHKENCVAEASSCLTRIINNSANQSLLDASANLDKDAKLELKRKYGPKSKIPVSANSANKQLPEYLVKQSLKTLHISNAEDMMLLLTSFAPPQYSALLKYAGKIDDSIWVNKELSRVVRSGALGSEGATALVRAIAENSDRIGWRHNFIVECNLNILEYLEQIPPNQRLAAVKEKNNHGSTVLHRAKDSPESLKSILESLPADQRLEAVNEKNKYGYTVLHLAAGNHESLKAILESLPEGQRLAAVKEKDEYGDTVLHFAAFNPESLRIVLGLCPEDKRLAAVKEKNWNDEIVLHLAVENPESLRIVLGLYPEEERLAAVKEQNDSRETVLHSAAGNPGSIETILTLILKPEQLNELRQRHHNLMRNDIDGLINYLEQAQAQAQADAVLQSGQRYSPSEGEESDNSPDLRNDSGRQSPGNT